MTFTEAKAMQDQLHGALKATGAGLDTFPRLADGRVPDAVRATPEYTAAKAASAQAFARLQRFNAWFVPTFKVELRAERRARGR